MDFLLLFFACDLATIIFDHVFDLRFQIVISQQPLHVSTSNFVHYPIYMLSTCRCSHQDKLQLYLLQIAILASQTASTTTIRELLHAPLATMCSKIYTVCLYVCALGSGGYEGRY